MKFYLTGHKSFENRGCEAIVRSTVDVLRKTYGNVSVLVPSTNIKRDSRQWPEASDYGAELVPAYQPWHRDYWEYFQRFPMPALKRAGWPFHIPSWVRAHIASVDAVLSIGGDNYSLDYGFPSLWMGMDGLAMDMGKPVMLWGASVGPFESEPNFVPVIIKHLKRMTKIMVRESVTFEYLTKTHSLTNVGQMADPAFILKPKAAPSSTISLANGLRGVIGLNVSPLIERYKNPNQSLLDELEAFTRTVVEQDFSLLLVPHVILYDVSRKDDDFKYMNALLERCTDLGDRVSMADPELNAAELKYIIGQLRFFIGARTHSTIAALSSGVPTASIAYSVKARGINRDLLGDERAVLSANDVSTTTLLKLLDYLLENEWSIKLKLRNTTSEYSAKALSALQSHGGAYL